jgi:uracil-DNA glycosylase family 4
MDARERLRRYLEQRRDLGESELVLDNMTVEDVMRVVGAVRPGGVIAKPAAPMKPLGGDAPPPSAAPVAGDEAVAPADHPRLRGEGAPGVQELPPAPRIEPERAERGGLADRVDLSAAESGDWRAALRAAGLGGPGGVPPAGAPHGGPARADAAADETPESDDMPSKRAPRSTGSPAKPRPRADDADQPSAGMADSSAPGAGAVADATRQPPAHGVPATGELFPGTDIPVGLVVGAARDLLGGPFDHLEDLDAIARSVHQCRRCPLYQTATHGVPGEGNPDADFVVVGEAPGAEEDASGRPFVGASGQLLTKILAAINLAREDVFICNVVKHRPPGNRNPTPDEVEACSPYLVRQLELVRPKVILTVGNFAAQTLLGTKLGIGKLRGQAHLYHGVPLIATYHPAALLRNPAWKRPTWEDVQLARRLLDRAASAG